MMGKLVYAIILCFLTGSAFSLSGKIKSSQGSLLSGCTVSLDENGDSTVSQNGNFEFQGLSSHSLEANHVGISLVGQQLFIEQSKSGLVQFEIFDIHGKEILEKKTYFEKGSHWVKPLFDVKNKTPYGVYYIHVENESGKKVFKTLYKPHENQIHSTKQTVQTRTLYKNQKNVVDKIRIVCPGNGVLTRDITSYQQDLGELVVSPPNVVFILVDDMGFSDIAAYGGEINTPHLSKLASEGLRFTQFYNTSKCFPSRATLLTGAYASQVGMNGSPGNIQNATTLAHVLKSKGYRTLAAGKHHGTQGLHELGFDKYSGLRDGAGNHFNPGVKRSGEAEPAKKRTGRKWVIDNQLYSAESYTFHENFYTTDDFTKWAIDYLEEYKSESKPFFLYLAYTAPHDPLQAWPSDIAKYQGEYMQGWSVVRNARFQRMKDLGLIPTTSSLPTFSGNWSGLSQSGKEERDLRMAIYAAMVDRVDQKIGELLDKLEELGELENTLILFASDNGGSDENAEGSITQHSNNLGSVGTWVSLAVPDVHWATVSNTPFKGHKNDSHEGGVRTPLIAYWPQGIRNPGDIIHKSGHLVDIMPTLVEMTNATYPTTQGGESVVPMQGESFYSELLGRSKEREKPIYFEWSKGKGIRLGKWKAITHSNSWNSSSNWNLYNMDTDPTESQNKASGNTTIRDSLVQVWKNWKNSN